MAKQTVITNAPEQMVRNNPFGQRSVGAAQEARCWFSRPGLWGPSFWMVAIRLCGVVSSGSGGFPYVSGVALFAAAGLGWIRSRNDVDLYDSAPFSVRISARRM